MRLPVVVVLASLGTACGSFHAADEEPADASADAGASTSVDAGPAGSGGDAGSSSGSGPCRVGHFCDDFERPQPKDADWSVYTSGTHAALDIDDTQHVSGSRSLHATAVPSSETSVNELVHDFGPAHSITVSFAFRRDQGTPAGELQPVAITDQAPNTVFVVVEPNGFGLADYVSGVKDSQTVSLPSAGAWSRYELTVDYDAHSARLTRDGAVLVSIKLDAAHVPTPTLRIGLHAANAPSGTASFWFDDVDVSVTP